MTLIVNGTWESEFRTIFWPSRLIYSEMTGSFMTFDCVSTCCEICFTSAICFSRPYQLPIPFEQPTFRFPMALTSSMPPSCGVLVAEGSTVTAAGVVVLEVAAGVWASLFLSFLWAKEGAASRVTIAKAAINENERFITTSTSAHSEVSDLIISRRGSLPRSRTGYLIGRIFPLQSYLLLFLYKQFGTLQRGTFAFRPHTVAKAGLIREHTRLPTSS